MIYADFKGFVEKLPTSGRIMAVDWGSKRTGYAVSDISRGFVADSGVITDNPVVMIPKILTGTTPHIVGIVLGLPLLSDGSDSDTTRTVRLFADSLATMTDVPVIFLDEGMTSAAAEDRIRNMDIGRRRRSHLSIDAVAATVLLEDALSKIQRLKK